MRGRPAGLCWFAFVKLFTFFTKQDSRNLQDLMINTTRGGPKIDNLGKVTLLQWVGWGGWVGGSLQIIRELSSL